MTIPATAPAATTRLGMIRCSRSVSVKTTSTAQKARPVGKRNRAGFISKRISVERQRAPHPLIGATAREVESERQDACRLQLQAAVEAGRVVEELEAAGAGAGVVDAHRNPQLRSR